MPRTHTRKAPSSSKQPKRKPGWRLRADVCESLSVHFNNAEDIVKQADVIIHYIDTGRLRSAPGKPKLHVVGCGND